MINWWNSCTARIAYSQLYFFVYDWVSKHSTSTQRSSQRWASVLDAGPTVLQQRFCCGASYRKKTPERGELYFIKSQLMFLRLFDSPDGSPGLVCISCVSPFFICAALGWWLVPLPFTLVFGVRFPVTAVWKKQNVSSPSTIKTQYCGEPPWPRCSVLDLRLQGLNFETCVWRAVSSHSSHHP